MWKNWLLKKRAPISTLSEIFIPVIIMMFLALIRGVVDRTDKPDPQFHDSPIAADFYDWQLIDDSYRQYWSNRLPTNKIRGGAGQKIAFIPGSNPAVQRLISSLSNKYPVLSPILFDRLHSNDELNDYVQAGSYGDSAHPYLQAAVVFNNLNNNNNNNVWDYTIRLNVSNGRPDESTQLDTELNYKNDINNRYIEDQKWELIRNGFVRQILQ